MVLWLFWAGWALAWLRMLCRGRPTGTVFRRFEPAAVHVKSNKKPDWVVRQLVLLKAHLPDAGCRTLAMTFNRVFAHREMSVSKSFVHQVLREQAHAVWLARKTIRAARPKPVAVNHCWGIDLTGRGDDGGDVHTVLGILDHGSRRTLALTRLTRKCGWTLLGQLCLAIAEFGRPKFVRTDNERCFTGRVFAGGLRMLGNRHQRIDLHCPWQNGRVERFFGTLKGCLHQLALADGVALDQFLTDFGRWYNELRPHQNLGGATPIEAWRGIDPFHAPTEKAVDFVQGWDGLLAGFRIRR